MFRDIEFQTVGAANLKALRPIDGLGGKGTLKRLSEKEGREQS